MLAFLVRGSPFAPLWVHPLDPYLGLVGFCSRRICAGSIGDDEGTSAATCLAWSLWCVTRQAQVVLVSITMHLQLVVSCLCCDLGRLGQVLLPCMVPTFRS